MTHDGTEQHINGDKSCTKASSLRNEKQQGPDDLDYPDTKTEDRLGDYAMHSIRHRREQSDGKWDARKFVEDRSIEQVQRD